MTGQYEAIKEAADFLRQREAAPRCLVILGTGLGGLSAKLEERWEVPYEAIPHFPVSTAPGHTGQLAFGRHGGTEAMFMEGRFHYYEGYTLAEVTLPVRVARALGAEFLIITSAVGGLAPDHEEGDILAIRDHINLLGDSPLRGPNDDRLGPRFPDMLRPYDHELIERAERIAADNGFGLERAVLSAVPGPQLETPAEYRWLRKIGADAVGMSTVPEAIVAVHAGLRTVALSVVTDLGLPAVPEPIELEKIIAVANAAAPRLETLILGLLAHV